MLYLDWTEILCRRVLLIGQEHGPIERIEATPEFLVALGDVHGEPQVAAVLTKLRAQHPEAEIASLVAQNLTNSLRQQLTVENKHLGAYCTEHRVAPGVWDRTGYDPPFFFAALWFTCLVGHGYPEEVVGAFHARMTNLLGRRGTSTGPGGSLNDAWCDVASWARQTRDNRNSHAREFLLPDPGTRTQIGISHFLASPKRGDRRILARMLHDLGLLGRDPPLPRVLASISQSLNRFTSEFRDDFTACLADPDITRTTLWRIIRNECRRPSVGPGLPEFVQASGHLLATWPEDRPLQIGLAVAQGAAVAEQIAADAPWEALDPAVGEANKIAWLSAEQLEPALAEPKMILDLEEAAHVLAGFVPLVDNGESWTLRVATASELNDASIVLVREDVRAVMEESGSFGGLWDPTVLPGWSVLSEAVLSMPEGQEPPESMPGEEWAQRSELPRPALRGGIRIGGAHTFLFTPPPSRTTVPTIRVPGADRVRLVLDGADGEIECQRDEHTCEFVIPLDQLAEAVPEGGSSSTWVPDLPTVAATALPRRCRRSWSCRTRRALRRTAPPRRGSPEPRAVPIQPGTRRDRLCTKLCSKWEVSG